MRIFITGKPGSGKTTLIKKIVDELSDKQITISGFYTAEIRDGDRRKGFRIITIPEHNRYILSETEPPGIQFGKYYVKTEGMENAISALKREADIYIIDEIGPMELKNVNFMPVVGSLLTSDRNIIAVVHRNLINLVDKENLYNITRENWNELYREIMGKLENSYE